MKKILPISLAVLFFFPFLIFAQIPTNTVVQISRAEDELRFDKTLETLMRDKDAKIRARAALAAGRIGKEAAIPALIELLEKDANAKVRATAAFALGEIESIKGADALLTILQNTKNANELRARAVEAAGKIAAANVKEVKGADLGKAILETLQFENNRGAAASIDVVLLGITAILRAKPAGGDAVTAKFLTSGNPRIRADAANTLSRLRAKNANVQLRAMLLADKDAVARANAARALGAAEDKDAFDILLKSAATDTDSRVRVSAIRSIGSLKDAKAADKLLARGEILLTDYKKSKFATPNEKSELLEIASSLGRLLPNTNSETAVKLLQNLRTADKFRSPEVEIAFAQIAPKIYVSSESFNFFRDSGFGMGFFSAAGAVYYTSMYMEGLGSFAQGLSEIAENKTVDKETFEKAQKNISFLHSDMSVAIILANPEVQAKLDGNSEKNLSAEQQSALKEEVRKFNILKKNLINSFPDVLRAVAKLKPEKLAKNESDIADFLINKPVTMATGSDGKKYFITYERSDNSEKELPYYLLKKDAIVRATAAELIGETKEADSSPALRAAFDFAVGEDKDLNDAQLAILNAIVKQNRESAKRLLSKALESPDYLVRRRAAQLIKQNDLTKDFPNADEKVGTVKHYDPQTGTKLGQVLNGEADYVRALSRRSASAILTTEKGTFTIEFSPEAAPLTVDNFIKLARAKYFDGLAIHRVVPNFVMQDGDPRGDGNGGPGWSIRDEINTIPFERGTVGMALSGKDTGGSQWFVCHAPQPHLDGGYTVFGRVNEADMKIVDNLVRGDIILSVKIVEGGLPQRTQRIQKRNN